MNITETRITRTSRRLRAMAAATASLLVATALSAVFSAPAQAAESTSLQFTTTIDTTQFGGAPNTPVRIIYTFNPDLPGGNEPGTQATYGPLDGLIIEIGDQCAALSGSASTIDIFNDAGSTIVDDAYVVNYNTPDAENPESALFGHDMTFFSFNLTDSDQTMFSDLSLPTNLDFVEGVDQMTLQFRLDSVRVFASFDVPFQLTPYDPVGTLASIQGDVAALQLNTGLKMSLLTKLAKAGEYAAGTSSNSAAKAEKELRNFISQVNALRGKEIPAGTADALISRVNGVIDALPACS